VANACLTYSALTGLPEYREVAERALSVVATLAGRAPRAVGWGLVAATALLAGPLEVAVVGDPSSPDFAVLRRVALMGTSPGLVVALGDGEPEADAVPLLRDRPARAGRATAYVCRAFACEAPTSEPVDLAVRIGAREGGSGE
jgi:uncharacterized protein